MLDVHSDVPACNPGSGVRRMEICWRLLIAMMMMMKNPRHDRSCSRADSRLQSSIIHNNYPIHVSLLGIYRYSSDTPQSTHISCFVSAVPPSPVSHAILIPPSQIIAFVTVCITSPRYWLIIWSPTHYQTQTSPLLRVLQTADGTLSRVLQQDVWSISDHFPL